MPLSLSKTYASYALAIAAAEYVMGIVPRGTHNWQKFLTPQEVNQMLEKHDLFKKSLIGTIYNPFTKQWSWISDTNITYAMYAQKFEPSHPQQ